MWEKAQLIPLVVNDVLISSVSCSYSSLAIISITILWCVLVLISWVDMGYKDSSWLGIVTLADNIASPVSAVVWIKPASIQIGQIFFTFMPCNCNSTSKSKDILSESWLQVKICLFLKFVVTKAGFVDLFGFVWFSFQ